MIKFLLLVLLYSSIFMINVIAKIPNPYKVLGISQNANEDDIKAGFKKRSKKYHPDRNKKDPRAKQKFQKIVNAYELLKDPQRKQMYDMTGDQDPNHQQQGHGGGFGGFGGGFGGINIEDLMRQGFGGFGGGHPGGHGHHRQQRRGRQGGATYSFSFGGGDGVQFEF